MIVKKIMNYKWWISLSFLYLITLFFPFFSVLSNETYGYVPKWGFSYLLMFWPYPVILCVLLIGFALVKAQFRKGVVIAFTLVFAWWYLRIPVIFGQDKLSDFFVAFKLFHIGYYLTLLLGGAFIFLMIKSTSKSSK